ncbi:hypothetical protein FHS56_002346 [Thermonema lapsum]|uniref:Uncharacterized protein n=1 Tax=Thermonema lapsum TaxID=28195 RepID=A0A846MTB6_9BACT|nr:hypothetical protein [Thermonema lapsum]NIK74813.1 hypothetical protein [Thermonema lapsum]
MSTELQIEEEKSYRAFQLSLNFVKASMGNTIYTKIDSAITGEPEPTIKYNVDDFIQEAADAFKQSERDDKQKSSKHSKNDLPHNFPIFAIVKAF